MTVKGEIMGGLNLKIIAIFPITSYQGSGKWLREMAQLIQASNTKPGKEFNLWSPHSRRREPTLTCCSLSPIIKI